MPRYPVVLFDLDHTLFDFDASEAAAFDRALESSGVVGTPALFDEYQRINKVMWAEIEAGRLSAAEVRLRRFADLVAVTGIAADPELLAEQFVLGLGQLGGFYPGATDLIRELHGDGFRLGLVTNGFGDVQRARLDRSGVAECFTAVVISAEVGVAKPHAGIFDVAFGQLDHPERHEVLMVGDSLASDIAGGVAAGIDTCWLNPHARPVPDVGAIPTHVATGLAGVAALVRATNSSPWADLSPHG